MSYYLESYIIGSVLGFLYNFPPKKIQYLTLFISAILITVTFAWALDNNVPLFRDYGWGNIVFNIFGYITGYVSAFALRTQLGVNWK